MSNAGMIEQTPGWGLGGGETRLGEHCFRDSSEGAAGAGWGGGGANFINSLGRRGSMEDGEGFSRRQETIEFAGGWVGDKV